MVDIALPRRGHWPAAGLLGVLARAVRTLAVLAVTAVVAATVFHVEVMLAQGRPVLVYPGRPGPGESVVVDGRMGALVTFGPATVATVSPTASAGPPPPSCLAVDGMTTTWPSPRRRLRTAVPTGQALVEIAGTYRLVPGSQVRLAAQL